MLTAPLTDPNLAFLLLVLGALGVFWEWHAPGMFVPGLLGILLLSAGAYGIYEDSPSWYGFVLFLTAALLLTIEFKYYTHMISGVAGTILLAVGAIVILEGPRRVSPDIAVAVSLAFGIITVFLGFLGMRARQAKHATGIESLIGEVGVARTEIDPQSASPQGVVFVHGEYWQARSQEKILPGRRVCVERVQDLIAYVKEA
jgi:membrane-bound serine protease (ClpP class)